MNSLAATTYIAIDSSVHSLDARSKIIMLVFYSVCLFFIDTWIGMAGAFLLFALALAASKLPLRKVFGVVVPVYVIVAFTVLFNMFLYQDGHMSFQPSGLLRGCFFGVRILLLVWASLIVCYSSTSTQLTDALSSFLRPFGRLKVPVDDIAMIFSIALRFIPLTYEEFERIKKAQWSRGANFDEGGLLVRMKAYASILIPMFVGLFRRADNLAAAMEVRCYGLPGVRRTSMHAHSIDGRSAAVAVVFCAACVALAALL